jgi:hypothetical protein
MKTSAIHFSLADRLREAGRLLQNKSDGGPLRNVQRLLWDHEDSVAGDSNIRFLEFFLSIFIDKVFYNLAGDIPSTDGVKDIQGQFYKDVGSVLCDLSEYLREGKYSEFWSCYVKLGIAYLDAVHRLNREL